MTKTTKKAIIISVAVVMSLVVCFFAIWGVAQIQLSSIAYKPVVGSVEEINWSSSDTFNIDKYKSFTVGEGANFNLLTMTDLHFANDGWYASESFWGSATANRKADKHVKTLVKTVNPDLIILTGDVQTGTLNDKNFQNLTDLMDSFKKPWTVTFGNHDGEHRADKPALVNIMQKSKYCIFDQGPTNLGTAEEPQSGGLGNTVINLKKTNGEVFYSLILTDTGDWQNLDSNLKAKKREKHAYSRVGVGWTDRQIEWYEWVLKGVESYNKTISPSATMPKSMLLQHIPSKIYDYAVMLGDFKSSDPSYTNNDVPFDTEAGWSRPSNSEVEGRYNNLTKLFYNKINKFEQYKQSEMTNLTTSDFNMTIDEIRTELQLGYQIHKTNDLFMSKVLELGSTNYMVTGHNHCDGFETRLDGITYVSVVKTTDIYVHTDWDMGNRGGTQILINYNNGTANVSTIARYITNLNATSSKYPR